jgi:thymidylate synthase ThyX
VLVVALCERGEIGQLCQLALTAPKTVQVVKGDAKLSERSSNSSSSSASIQSKLWPITHEIQAVLEAQAANSDVRLLLPDARYTHI